MKYLSIIRYVLLIISVLVVAVPFITQGSAPRPDVEYMLQWTYIMIGLSLFFVIVLPIMNIGKNPKGALRSLVGVVLAAVVFGIAYSMADATPIQAATEVYDDPALLKLSDTGLFVTYFACGAAIASIVLTEVYKLFK